MRSWSGDVRKLSIDERPPRPVVSGKFFADEDDSGRRSWEAFVTLAGGLEELDVDRECTVVFELENGRRVRGRAVTEPEQADTPDGEERYLFVGTGPLAPLRLVSPRRHVGQPATPSVARPHASSSSWGDFADHVKYAVG